MWLAGDCRQWDPGDDGKDLWEVLRLAVLYFLWAARCHGRSDGRPPSARVIVAQLVYYLRGRIVADAVRAFSPLHDYAITGGEWLPDRPTLSPAQFDARWAVRGVLCTRSLPDGPVHLHLNTAHPVPLPP